MKLLLRIIWNCGIVKQLIVWNTNFSWWMEWPSCWWNVKRRRECHHMLGLSNFETFQTQTFKLSNFRARNSADFRTFNLHAFQSFNLCKLSIFRTLKLSNSQTFKPSNLKPFEVWNLRTLKLATSATSRGATLKPALQTSNFRTFKLSNFRTFELSNLRTFEPSNFQRLKPSNLRVCQLSKSPNFKLRRPDRTRPRQKFEVWVWSSQSSSKVRKFESLKLSSLKSSKFDAG